jgi:hypothetical protein
MLTDNERGTSSVSISIDVLTSNQTVLDVDLNTLSLLDSQKLIWMKLINQDEKLKALQESQKQILANQIIIFQNQNLLFEEIQDQSEKSRNYIQHLAEKNNIFTLYAKEIQVNLNY